MNNFQIISILETIYIIYFLNYFKTRYSIAHPLTYFNNKYFRHPIGVNDKPICNVCQFGKDGAWLIAIYLILRLIFYKKYNKFFLQFSKLALVIIFTLSLMNFNVVVYLIPFYITEMYIIRNSFNV